MSCKCGSERIAEISGKCSDCCGYTVAGRDGDGYVPYNLGVGGGDYIELKWCLDCGQIQGKFPIAPHKLEQPPERCDTCDERIEIQGDYGRCMSCTNE